MFDELSGRDDYGGFDTAMKVMISTSEATCLARTDNGANPTSLRGEERAKIGSAR